MRSPEVIAGFATESGHWYRADGSPAYSIIGANGKERPTTLRDAKKLGLLPSVTTIAQMEDKPQLTRWLVQQGMMSCLTLPRMPDESDDQLMARALTDSREQSRKAAERGTYLHGLIEQAISGQVFRASDADILIVQPVLTWLEVNFAGYSGQPERSFASELGYGGKIDLYGTRTDSPAVVIDFKCKADIHLKQKLAKDLAYDEHCSQLAAYANGLRHPDARCINLFIDTDVPGHIVPHEWPREQVEKGWQAFDCLLRLFQIRKGLV